MAGEAPTTELEAVNSIIATIGEAPIDTLALTGLLFVDQAYSILKEVSRSVQLKGWHFNTDENYPTALNINNEIEIATNVLKIDSTDEYADYDVVQRGTRLYNRTDHSFVFDQAIEVNITWFLPYEDLPEAARRYILVRAARIFQDRVLGTAILHGFTERDEVDALTDLKDAEGESADYSIFDGDLNTMITVLRDRH